MLIFGARPRLMPSPVRDSVMASEGSTYGTERGVVAMPAALGRYDDVGALRRDVQRHRPVEVAAVWRAAGANQARNWRWRHDVSDRLVLVSALRGLRRRASDGRAVRAE